VRLLDFALLTDENIHPELVGLLRGYGHDVLDVKESGLIGSTDVDLMRRSVAERRVIITHDGDFGRLAVAAGEPVTGIVFLRPGHLDVAFSHATIDFLYRNTGEIEPPFLLVAERSGTQVKMRLRGL
jgi:predicted nuclease of predicted toxin-antitoxin system